MKRIISALMLVVLFAGSAFALSDAKYREFMKDPAFAKADRRLNTVWKKLKKELPDWAFEILQDEQSQWVSSWRDMWAKEYMDENKKLKPVKAYTRVTNERAEFLPERADSILQNGM